MHLPSETKIRVADAVNDRPPESGPPSKPSSRKRDDAFAELARRSLGGQQPALRELLRKLAPHLRRVVRDILGPEGDADDCVQEALVAIANALPTFRGDCTFLHFSIRIAIRCALSSRRRSQVNRRQSDRVVQLETPLIAAQEGTGERALASRRLTALRALLARLPAGQAHTFALHAVLDYSPKEISKVTGVPVNTVRSRIRLAREAMRRHIADNSALAELFTRQP
jgi:RNA polymerase sigma-70 factor (ECF subfamily)